MFKRVLKWIAIGIVVFLIMMIMIYFDVVSRAKECFKKGEKAYLQKDYHNALMWYETTIDLFRPPESKWVKKARQRIGEIKQNQLGAKR